MARKPKPRIYDEIVAVAMAGVLDSVGIGANYRAEDGRILRLGKFSSEWVDLTDPLAELQSIIELTESRLLNAREVLAQWKGKENEERSGR